MSVDIVKQKKRYDVSAKKLSDHNTPLIHNAWYVGATSIEIEDGMKARTVLGKNIVFYRDNDNKAIALQNRCCHRSFPLSEGKLENGNVRCGYHGLLFDSTGTCIEIPMNEKKPRGIQVASYPVIEKAGFIWIWMGEASPDESLLPYEEWMDSPERDVCVGYIAIKGSYVHMHENLLDLSHLSYIHETTFGTPEYATAPVDIKSANNGLFEVWRRVECNLPPIYAKPLGWEGKKARRHSGSRYVAPGLHVNTGLFEDLDKNNYDQLTAPSVKVAQLLTPETLHTTHYWYAVTRNFARDDKSIDEFMLGQQAAAFAEDAFAIDNILKLQLAEEHRDDFIEIDIPTDKAGVAMRKHLKKLANLEST